MIKPKLVVGGAVVVTSIVGGCHQPGPLSIITDRPDYNDVIQDTSKQQLFTNVIRVKSNETPLFMDVSEIDASVSLQGTLAGGPGGLGAPWRAMGVASSVTGTLQFTQSPIIRYTPLLGQSLIAQMSTPITVDSIVELIDSGWSERAVLDMSASRLMYDETPQSRHDVLDQIESLHSRGLLMFAAEKWPAPGVVYAAVSSFKPAGGSPPPPAPPGGGSPPPPSSSATPSPATPNGGNDTLALYFVGTEDQEADSDWQKLLAHYGDHFKFHHCLKLPVVPIAEPRSGMPTTQTFVDFYAPPLHTRSGMGVLLKFDDPELRGVGVFTTPGAASDSITKAKSPMGLTISNHFSIDLGKFKLQSQNALNVNGVAKTTQYTATAATADVLIKVLTLDRDPGPAYVKKHYQDVWYYIDSKDELSQRNFMLLGQFLTMQAGPPSAAPLTPTISVGGSGSGH